MRLRLAVPCLSFPVLAALCFPMLVALSAGHVEAQFTFLGQTVSTTNYNFPSSGFGPDSLAANASGYVVISDATQGRIYELTPQGQATVFGSSIGKWGSDAVTIDNAGNIYTSAAGLVHKTAPNGAVTTTDLGIESQIASYCESYAPYEGSGYVASCESGYGAYAMAVDPFGNLYLSFTDPFNFVVELPASGSPFILDTSPFNLNQPTGLAADRQGNVYIGDPYNDRIVVVTPVGSNNYGIGPPGLNLEGTNLNPGGIPVYGGGVQFLGVDSQGNIYVGSTNYWGGGNLLVEIPPDGQSYTVLPPNGGGALGIGVDADDNLYFSNNNGKIVKYSTRYANFGSVPVGTTSTPVTLTFKLGEAGENISNVAAFSLGSTSAGEFATSGPLTCTGAPGTCSVPVTFTPAAPGVRSGGAFAYLSITDGSTTHPAPEYEVPLYGTGTSANPVFDGANLPYSVMQVSSSVLGTVGQSVTDGAGYTYVAIPSQNEVLAISPGGASAVVNTGSYTLSDPKGVAIDGLGDLFIADTGNNRILKIYWESQVQLNSSFAFDSQTSILPTSGITLNGPTQLTTDAVGDLIVDNAGNGEVDKVLLSGISYPLATGIQSLLGIALDTAGDLYYISNFDVYEIPEATGLVTEVATSQLEAPTALAVDAGGTLYIADFYLGIVELHTDGTVSVNSGNELYGAQTLSVSATGALLVGGPGAPAGHSGTVLVQIARTTPPALSFDTTPVGNTSPDSPQIITVSNAGNVTSTFTQLTYPTDFPESGSSTNVCIGTSLAPGGECILPIAFEPTTAGTLTEDVTFTATSLGGANTQASVPVTGTGHQGGLSQTISSTLSGGTFTKTPSYPYSTAGPLIYIKASSGLAVSLTVISGPGSLNGSVLNPTAAGVVTVLATQAGNSTYAPAPPVTFSVTFTAAPISVNTRHSSFTQVYGAAAPTVTYLLSGLINQSDQVYLTITGGATPASPVGNDTIPFGLTGPMASSYYLAAGSTTGTLVVSPAPLTVAANDAYMMAGGTVPTFNYTLLGLVNGDTAATAVTGSPTLSAPATTSSPAGAYPIDLTLGTLASTNYALTAANGVLNVFSPIDMGSVAVGSTGTQAITFQAGPASIFGSVQGSTLTGVPGSALSNGPSAFHAGGFSCSAGTCSGTVDFAPSQPGSWTGAYSLLSQGSPSTLLLAIPATGTGAGPEIVFNPAEQTTFASSLSQPFGVVIDSAGNTYISESSNSANQVVEIPYGGGTPVPIGTGLNQPEGVAVDAAGDVFIADTGNFRVVEVPVGGGSQIVQSSGYTHVSGIAIDNSGNLYVTDSSANTVQLFPAGGASPVQLGSGWNSPVGVAVDGAGDVYVAQSGNNAITELPVGEGAAITLPITGTNDPSGVAVDPVGNVYVSDTINHRVLEMPVSGSGQITLVSGLGYPYLLTLNRNGDLYIPDLSNGQVLVLNPHQPASLNFGTPGSGGTLGPLAVAMTNVGNQALTFPVPASGNNPNVSAGFSFNSGAASACPLVTSTSSPGTLAAGSSCNLSVNFVPTAVESYTGSLVLTDNTLNAAAPSYATQSISLSGNYAGAPTTIDMGSDFNPSIYGESPTITAIVVSPSGTVFAGTVTFSVDGSQYPGAVNLSLTNGSASTLISGLPVGNHTITAAYSGSTSAVLAPSSSSPLIQAVNQASQIIGFYPAPSVTYGVAPITLTATGGGSGNPVTFTLASGPGTLSGANNSVLTVTGVGTIAIHANQAGNSNYTAAPQVTESIVVETPPLAALVSPASGSTLAGPSVTIKWSAISEVNGYFLHLGTTGVGSSNLLNSAEYSSTTTSVTVNNLPVNGQKIYARLFTDYNGMHFYQDYLLTESAQAVLTLPGTSGTLAGPTVKFGWSAATGSVNGYFLHIGSTSAGSDNLLNSAEYPTTTTSVTVNNLPLNGETIYVRVFTDYTGTHLYKDYTFTAAQQALLTSPLQGATLTRTAATFVWSAATGSVNGYFLHLGTTGAGSSNLLNSAEYPTSTTSVAVNNLPVGGGKIYARLFTDFSGTHEYQDYTFTAAPVTLSATSLSFGAVTVGSSSASQSVTLTNTGTATLTVSSIAVTGTNASSFVFANNCGTSVAVGASCTIHGHFAPTTKGALTAAITITDSAAGSPQSIALTGTGQ